jgi:hypothetical protein
MELFIGKVNPSNVEYNLVHYGDSLMPAEYVYVTKYATTRGVLHYKVVRESEHVFTVKDTNYINGRQSFSKKDCSKTIEEAQVKAQKMIRAQLASLEKQKAKLSALLETPISVIEVS